MMIAPQLGSLERTISLAGAGGICLAFSGGVDSAVVLAVAKRAGVPLLSVTFETFLHPHGDLAAAAEFSRRLGVPHQTIQINELSDENILQNAKDRCFHCKHLLFSHLLETAKEHQLACVMDGTNADDLHCYRPGLRALKELGIQSPLAENGITKQVVRQLAEHLGLSVASKSSAPCLATRLPYGTPLSPALLARIDQAERSLHAMGFSPLRVRIHGEIARIELHPNQFPAAIAQQAGIIAALRQEGFHHVTLDLAGFRSGSMDELPPDIKENA